MTVIKLNWQSIEVPRSDRNCSESFGRHGLAKMQLLSSPCNSSSSEVLCTFTTDKRLQFKAIYLLEIIMNLQYGDLLRVDSAPTTLFAICSVISGGCVMVYARALLA